MKKIILIIAIMLMAGQAFGATYYVKWDASGDADGSSWANAYTTIAGAVAAHNSAGTVIEISGGTEGHTYNESVNCEYGTAFSLKGSTETGHSGAVTISGAGKDDYTLKIDAQSVQNLTIMGADSGKWNLTISGNSAVSMTDVILGEVNSDRSSIVDKRNLATWNSPTITWTRCIIAGSGTSYNISAGATTTMTFNYCQFIDNWGRMILRQNTTFNNCLFAGGKPDYLIILFDTAGATVAFKNSIFAGIGAYNTTTEIVLNDAGGTITYDNCIMLSDPFITSVSFEGSAPTNPIYQSPRFVHPRREGYALWTVDDYDSLSDFSAIVAASGGTPINFALSTPSVVSAGEWTTLQGLVAAGHGILNHTMTHPDLTAATGITITGPATSTVSLAVTTSNNNPTLWTGTLSLKVDGSHIGASPYTINSGSLTTPNQVKTLVDSLGGGWSAAITAGTNGNSLTTAMTAVTDADASGGLALEWDYDKYIYYEVGYAKQLIEAGIGGGYVCQGFAYPGGSYNATVKEKIYAAGSYPSGISPHTLARSLGTNRSHTLADDYTSGTDSLAGLQIFEISSLHPATQAGASATDATIKERFASLAEFLNHAGAVMFFYGHNSTTDGANYYTADMINTAIQEMKAAGVTFLTANAFATKIRESTLWTDADSDGTRWTRTFTDNADYRLQSTSPAINAGTPVTGLHDVPCTDYYGRNCRDSTPDIGIYNSGLNSTIGAGAAATLGAGAAGTIY